MFAAIKIIISLFVNKINNWVLSPPKKTNYNSPNEKVLLFDYLSIISNRSILNFTELDELSKDISFELFHSLSFDEIEPNFYGSFFVLCNYSNLRHIVFPPQKLTIQHGYVFDLLSWEKTKLEKKNFVWSDLIVSMYREHTDNKNIISIGAPFFYADSLLSKEEIISEKKRLGTNLLAFPMHSSHFVDTNYDPIPFINVLKKERERFHSVRVCLYWKDILRGSADIYIKHGFECVCCGHIFDLNFLRRQNSLLQIADATISNGVGSHIGYSLFLKKPHLLVPDPFEYVDIKGTDGKELYSTTRNDNYNSVLEAFVGNNDYIISDSQLEIVDKFWGISSIKTPDELRTIILDYYR